LFNYPTTSHHRRWADVPEFGIKTCFLSNSFAAYRVKAMREAGGFPTQVILGEDMHLAARLLKAGHAIRYQASAMVYHSHSYSLREELGRYFDTGVFHAQQHWLIQTFGSAANEGIQFIHSEFRYLIKKSAYLLPEALLRTFLKYVGFKSGQLHAHMPQKLVKGLSMHKGFWV
jgi:rhamnosyltransferase